MTTSLSCFFTHNMWNWVLANPYQPCNSVHLVSGFPNLHPCHKGGNFRGLSWTVGSSEDELVLKRSIDWTPRLGQAVVTLHECSVAQLCLTLGNPMNCRPQGSCVHGILQAIILEWVAMPSSPQWVDISSTRDDPYKLFSPLLVPTW